MIINRVFIAGRLTDDPKLVETHSGSQIVNFSIACNERWGDKEHVSFIDVTGFGKTAETVVKYFHKGSMILIDGRLRQDAWQDKEGNWKRKVKIILEHFHFIEGKDEEPGEKSMAFPGQENKPTAAYNPQQDMPF